MLSNGALRDAPVSSAGVGRGRGPCSSICVRGLIPWARRTTASISSPQRPFRRGHRPCCGRGRRGAPRPGDEATMHPRDLFALLLSVVAVYIALQVRRNARRPPALGLQRRSAWRNCLHRRPRPAILRSARVAWSSARRGSIRWPSTARWRRPSSTSPSPCDRARSSPVRARPARRLARAHLLVQLR